MPGQAPIVNYDFNGDFGTYNVNFYIHEYGAPTDTCTVADDESLGKEFNPLEEKDS